MVFLNQFKEGIFKFSTPKAYLLPSMPYFCLSIFVSFIDSFNKCILSTNDTPGTMPDLGDSAVNMIDTALFLMEMWLALIKQSKNEYKMTTKASGMIASDMGLGELITG